MEELNFSSLPISELITIHKWVKKEKKERFPDTDLIYSHEDAKAYDSLNAKIIDISDIILSRIELLHKKTFADQPEF